MNVGWRFLIGKKMDRLPMDYWAVPEVDERLLEHFNCKDMRHVFDILKIDRPLVVEPKYVGPPLQKGKDYFGIGWASVSYGAGAYDEAVYHPLAKYNSVEEIEDDFVWPHPDWFDYSLMPETVKGNERLAIEGPFSEPYWIYSFRMRPVLVSRAPLHESGPCVVHDLV